MANFPVGKVNGDTLQAADWNQIACINNAITSTDQPPSDADLTQLAKAMAQYGSGNFYSDSGAANAYVLAPIGSMKSPADYFEGMEIRFRAGNSNTGAATVNVNGLGVKNIKKADGSTDPIAGDISTTYDTVARYDGTVFRLSLFEQASETVAGVAEIATTAETAAATAGKILDPAKLLELFNTSSQSLNGYMRLPVNVGGAFDEIIVQWGRGTTINADNTITFPIAFPNAVLNAVCCGWQDGAASDDNYFNIFSLSTTQIVLAYQSATTGGPKSAYPNYIVIGY